MSALMCTPCRRAQMSANLDYFAEVDRIGNGVGGQSWTDGQRAERDAALAQHRETRDRIEQACDHHTPTTNNRTEHQ